MKKTIFTIAFAALTTIFTIGASQKAQAHCEVPCGIYADSVRITMIMEHITTIEKAMNQINELSKSATPNYNQLVRWVTNKEEHAKQLQEITSQYFLHQRIKPVDPENAEGYKKYQKQLTHLHHILVYSMKCKQTTDLDNVAKLRQAVKDFESVYFHKH